MQGPEDICCTTGGGGGSGGGGLIGIGEIQGRGRAVIASQPLKAGQIVLRDSPLLVYSAIPFVGRSSSSSSYCSNCFRVLQSASAVISCPSCSTSSLFCSPNCRSIALTTSHTPWSCQILLRLSQYYHSISIEHEDRQVQARFLVAAYNLSLVSPSAFQSLLSLQGSAPQPPSADDLSISLHSLISSTFPPHSAVPQGFSWELTALLLAKDKLNAFGLMEPFSEGKERSVRAYGIYPLASFFNHDCLPNACRFDYLDTQPASLLQHSNNTDIVVRLIHDVPAGREICLSYFPVNLKYSERQKRLRDDYGFTCDCDRCKVEANWSDEEEEEEDGRDDLEVDDDDDTAVMDEDSEEHMAGSETGDAGGVVQGGDDDFPHAYFFLRYMCDRNNCWGTLAPLPPSGAIPSTILECNVCGNLKNFDEIMDGEVSGK